MSIEQLIKKKKCMILGFLDEGVFFSLLAARPLFLSLFYFIL
jgi:hypothetical protein